VKRANEEAKARRLLNVKLRPGQRRTRGKGRPKQRRRRGKGRPKRRERGQGKR